MKILVTGGAGFIGCNFVYYMLEKYPDAKVICIDSLISKTITVNRSHSLFTKKQQPYQLSPI